MADAYKKISFKVKVEDLDKAKNDLQKLGYSIENTKQPLERYVKNVDRARYANMNFNRIIQDSPYLFGNLQMGIMAIGNNIDPFIMSMTQLRQETGSTMGALKAFGRSFMGAGGFLSIVSLAVSAITAFSLANRGAKKETESFNLQSLIGDFDSFARSLAKTKNEIAGLSLEELNFSLKALKNNLKDAQEELTNTLTKAIVFQNTQAGGIFAQLFGGSEDDIKQAIQKVAALSIAIGDIEDKSKAPGYITQLRKNIEEITKRMDDAATKAAAYKIRINELEPAVKKLNEALGKNKDKIGNVLTLFEMQFKTELDPFFATDTAKKAYETMKKYWENLGGFFNKINPELEFTDIDKKKFNGSEDVEAKA